MTKKFDSGFEETLHGALTACEYHPDKIQYVQVKMYEPDFIYRNGPYKFIIEAKGRFRDRNESRKYIDIAAGLDDYTELVFIFQKPKTPMPFAKRRKNGTKQTHAEWAEKNNFKWYTVDTLPKEWKGC